MRGARSRGHRHDLVAIVLQGRPLAAHAHHAVEMPFALLVPDGGLARDGRRLPGGVAVLALGKPAARPQEEAVLYPWTCTESAGACARSSIV